MHDTTNAPAGQPLLQSRIGWLCQLVRCTAAAYVLWILYAIVGHWISAETVARNYGAWLRADLSGIAGWQRLAGFSLHFAIWLLAAAAGYSVWRLFSGYLSGRIFTLDAALWLGRAGIFGLAAEALDLATRPLTALIVSLHLPTGSRMVAFSFNPNDLLILLFLVGFVAMAHIFKAAAELAEDNAQIV